MTSKKNTNLELESDQSQRLIVLDLNGVLYNKTYSKETGISIKYFEGVDQFLKKCMDYANIAFFTSTTKKNAAPALHKLIGKYVQDTNYSDKIKFTWFREYTDTDYDSKNSWDTMKYYHKIKKKYPNYQIVMIDDTESKVRFNPPECTIIVDNVEETGYFDMLLLDIMWKFFHLDEKHLTNIDSNYPF